MLVVGNKDYNPISICDVIIIQIQKSMILTIKQKGKKRDATEGESY